MEKTKRLGRPPIGGPSCELKAVVPVDLRREVMALAKERRVSMSRLVRVALRRLLDELVVGRLPLSNRPIPAWIEIEDRES